MKSFDTAGELLKPKKAQPVEIVGVGDGNGKPKAKMVNVEIITPEPSEPVRYRLVKEGDPETTEEKYSAPEGYRLVKEPKSERIQLLVTQNTKKLLKQKANATCRSVNDLINEAIEKYLIGG